MSVSYVQTCVMHLHRAGIYVEAYRRCIIIPLSLLAELDCSLEAGEEEEGAAAGIAYMHGKRREARG